MELSNWILAALAVLAALAALRRLGGKGGGAWQVPPRAPHPRYPDFAEFARFAPGDVAKARLMLRAFSEAYQRTFASCATEHITDMHETRQRALASLYAVRLSLPNEAATEDRLTQEIERVEKSTLAHVDDVATRCRFGLVHPYPVGDFYYSRWYRAANDRPGNF